MTFLKQVEAHLKSDFPFLKNGTLLMAFSGGVDSLVAATVLHKLGYKMVLAHCNFKLRGQASNLDEAFAKDWAKHNNILYFTTSFETSKYADAKKISIQEAARNLRYKWFQKLLIQEHLDYIVTAHQANDNLETTLINLTRGTGFKGLLGIPSQNGKIVRPFLHFQRKAIETYAVKNHLTWREDASNASVKYTRNKIRHQVVPVLDDINPNLLDTFQQNLSHLKGVEQIIEDRILTVKKELLHKISESVYSIDIQKILELSNPKAYLYELLKTYGFTAWDDVESLLSAQSGKYILSPTHRLVKNRTVLLILELKNEAEGFESYIIEQLDQDFKAPDFNLSFETAQQVDYNNANQNIVYIDADIIKAPLIVRKWQKGDYFYPLGMQGKKKLSDFFTDQKMALPDKENVWLLCQDQAIIWVIGKRLSNPYRITEQTKQVLKITYQQ